MKKREFHNILALHADQLNSGRDQTDTLVQQYGSEAPELGPLLHLARRIRAVLVPVTPREAFVRQLEQELLVVDRQLMVAMPESPWRPAWVGAATLGSLLSLVGLVLLLRRQRTRPEFVDVAAG